MRERHQHCSVISTERTSSTMATQEQMQEVLQRLQLQGQRIAVLEGELKIEETRAQTAEIESALIQTLVTMRQERGAAMMKNGNGKGKPNSA